MLMISSLWHLLRSCILYIEVGGGILDKCWYFFYSDQKHSFCVTSKAGGDVLDVQCHPRNMVWTSLTSSKLLILTCLCWKLEGSPPPFSRNIRNATSFDSAQAKKPLRHWSVQILYDLAVGTVLPLKFLGEKDGFCSQLSFWDFQCSPTRRAWGWTAAKCRKFLVPFASKWFWVICMSFSCHLSITLICNGVRRKAHPSVMIVVMLDLGIQNICQGNKIGRTDTFNWWLCATFNMHPSPYHSSTLGPRFWSGFCCAATSPQRVWGAQREYLPLVAKGKVPLLTL